MREPAIVTLLRRANPLRVLGLGSTFDTSYDGDRRDYATEEGTFVDECQVGGRPWSVVRSLEKK